MDGSVGLIEEYASWLDARHNGKRLHAFPMGNTHESITKILDKRRYSFDEVIELFAGITALRYCEDRTDARVAIGLFADKLLQMVVDKKNDEDSEMVDRIDAGGF